MGSTFQATPPSDPKATPATRRKGPSIWWSAACWAQTSAQRRRAEAWSTALPAVVRSVHTVFLVCTCRGLDGASAAQLPLAA